MTVKELKVLLEDAPETAHVCMEVYYDPDECGVPISVSQLRQTRVKTFPNGVHRKNQFEDRVLLS